MLFFIFNYRGDNVSVLEVIKSPWGKNIRRKKIKVSRYKNFHKKHYLNYSLLLLYIRLKNNCLAIINPKPLFPDVYASTSITSDSKNNVYISMQRK